MTIRVELDMFNLCKLRDEDLMQLTVRQTLGSAGIPLGPWGSSAPSRGALSWRDDPARRVRVVEWIEPEEPK